MSFPTLPQPVAAQEADYTTAAETLMVLSMKTMTLRPQEVRKETAAVRAVCTQAAAEGEGVAPLQQYSGPSRAACSPRVQQRHRCRSRDMSYDLLCRARQEIREARMPDRVRSIRAGEARE